MKTVLIAEDDRTTRLLVRGVLKSAGFSVATAANGALALKQLREKDFDLLLTDIWMPRLNGLELLASIRELARRPRVLVMTSDSTPETLLRAVREQAYHYVTKPIDPKALVELVRDSLAAKPTSPPIEVLSARPDWVELLVPCDLEVANRITSFMDQLRTDLPDDIRGRIGIAFRELLTNAVEWGGKLDPNQKVRISCLRARRMVLYRIADPGTGFRFEGLKRAALENAPDRPWEHIETRAQMGVRPGGYGLLTVKAIADELLYNETQNEVVFVKYLEP